MNNLVTITDGQAVTTTLAIADGTDNEHASVLLLARKYKADLEEFGSVAFETRPRPAGQHGGADVEFANLNEQQATLLLTYMRNSDIVRFFKKRLVKAFYELAQRAKQGFDPANLSRMDLIRIAMDAESERLQLEQQVQALEPKADALDRIATADGTFCLQSAAKHQQVKPQELIRILHRREWIYKRPGSTSWLAYQNRIQQGYLIHKVTTVHRQDGTEKVCEQVRVTGKGMAALARLLDEEPGQRSLIRG